MFNIGTGSKRRMVNAPQDNLAGIEFMYEIAEDLTDSDEVEGGYDQRTDKAKNSTVNSKQANIKD